MVETAFKEKQSEELQEIMSSPPSWLVSYGIAALAGIFLVLLLCSWWIRYPDIVSASFMLTTENGPRKIVSRRATRVERLFVFDGTVVSKGETIAYLEGNGQHASVLGLERDLDALSKHISKGEWEAVNNFGFKRWAYLGDVQYEYQVLFQSLMDLKLRLNASGYLQKKNLLSQEIADLEKLNDIAAQQYKIASAAREVATQDFETQEKLFREKIISTTEFNREKTKHIEGELPLKNLAASIIQNNSQRIAKQREILDLENSIFEHKANFARKMETLQSKIEGWKYDHIVVAPISGVVSLFGPWQEQQAVSLGQELLTIEPRSTSFRGILKISQNKIGKLRLGQKVFVELAGYPYREYGMLEGELTSFSATPGFDSTYWGSVSFKNGLLTTYRKKITYKNGLQGIAKIETSNYRLMDRVLNAVRGGRNL